MEWLTFLDKVMFESVLSLTILLSVLQWKMTAVLISYLGLSVEADYQTDNSLQRKPLWHTLSNEINIKCNMWEIKPV